MGSTNLKGTRKERKKGFAESPFLFHKICAHTCIKRISVIMRPYSFRTTSLVVNKTHFTMTNSAIAMALYSTSTVLESKSITSKASSWLLCSLLVAQCPRPDSFARLPKDIRFIGERERERRALDWRPRPSEGADFTQPRPQSYGRPAPSLRWIRGQSRRRRRRRRRRRQQNRQSDRLAGKQWSRRRASSDIIHRTLLERSGEWREREGGGGGREGRGEEKHAAFT